MPRESSRTKKIRATFYWRQCVSGKHVDEAAMYLMACVTRVQRRSLTTYGEADLRGIFRKRLVDAEKGRLLPRDECKPIRLDPEVYEIRWADVPIPCKDPVSGLFGEPDAAHFRLYYGEPSDAPWFLGLHAHEKVIVEGDDAETEAIQDVEIARAVTVFRHDAGCWGVAELEGQGRDRS